MQYGMNYETWAICKGKKQILILKYGSITFFYIFTSLFISCADLERAEASICSNQVTNINKYRSIQNSIKKEFSSENLESFQRNRSYPINFSSKIYFFLKVFQ